MCAVPQGLPEDGRAGTGASSLATDKIMPLFYLICNPGYVQIEATKAICDQAGSPIVFSHNDLLSGNILIVQQRQQQGQGEQQGQQPSDDSSMQFIDYEYSACGYR